MKDGGFRGWPLEELLFSPSVVGVCVEKAFVVFQIFQISSLTSRRPVPPHDGRIKPSTINPIKRITGICDVAKLYFPPQRFVSSSVPIRGHIERKRKLLSLLTKKLVDLEFIRRARTISL